jgi:hypothetical protein
VGDKKKELRENLEDVWYTCHASMSATGIIRALKEVHLGATFSYELGTGIAVDPMVTWTDAL